MFSFPLKTCVLNSGLAKLWLLRPPLLHSLSNMKRGSCFHPSESSERGQRLPKINRPSVQPQGWVRVSLHGAHSLGSQCSYPNTAAHLSTG